jgi:hypothetical protein
MSFFPGAKDFVINDGIFSNVQGNQNQFNCGSGPSQIIGRDNLMAVVNGSFHNGPNSSIRSTSRSPIRSFLSLIEVKTKQVATSTYAGRAIGAM